MSILKPVKVPKLPSSYRPTSLLDTFGNVLEKILKTKVLLEANKRLLLSGEQFGFLSRPIDVPW